MIALVTFAVAVAATVIPRVDQGNIRSWQVPDARTVYLEDAAGQSCRADMRSACVRLNLNEQIGFHTSAGGRLDRFSQIITRGGNCPIGTLTNTLGPPEKS